MQILGSNDEDASSWVLTTHLPFSVAWTALLASNSGSRLDSTIGGILVVNPWMGAFCLFDNCFSASGIECCSLRYMGFQHLHREEVAILQKLVQFSEAQFVWVAALLFFHNE